MSGLTADILLNEESKRVVKIAQATAKENMNPEFGPAHLLKACYIRMLVCRAY